LYQPQVFNSNRRTVTFVLRAASLRLALLNPADAGFFCVSFRRRSESQHFKLPLSLPIRRKKTECEMESGVMNSDKQQAVACAK